MSTRHQHKFQRLSDVAVFCPTCGEIRTSNPEALCTRPHYPTYPYPYWWWQPYTGPYYPWTVTTVATGDGLTVGSTYADIGTDDNVTYTLTSGSVA